MPLITTIKCNHCNLQLPTGAGGYLYVLNPAGQRIPCPHPLETHTIKQVTGLDWHAAHSKGLLGQVSHCLCFTCAYQFDLDVERDIKRCPHCTSLEVRTATASLAAKCPQCPQGSPRRTHPWRVLTRPPTIPRARKAPVGWAPPTTPAQGPPRSRSAVSHPTPQLSPFPL